MRKFKTFSNIYNGLLFAPFSEVVNVVSAGTRCVLGAFAIDLTVGTAGGGVASYTFTDLPRVEFQSMDASFTPRFAVPAVFTYQGVADFPGAHSGVLNKVPGPGILFDNGMRFQIDIPSGGSELYVSVNLVYSV